MALTSALAPYQRNNAWIGGPCNFWAYWRGSDTGWTSSDVGAGQATVTAQTSGTQAAAAPADGNANRTPPFKNEELEAIVAPIALYPDALLAQIFMASTYPLEIVEAARWSKEHPDVKGDAVAGAVQSQPWDPSVKSLCAFPSVLENMNNKIDWTQKLGDAFLAQQKEVMQAVQILRGKAKETGNLKSTKEVTVKEEPAPAGSPVPQTIIIESPDPEVVYVPTYNTATVYGAWATHRGLDSNDRSYAITHVPSGRCVPRSHTDLLTRAQAISVARRLDDELGDKMPRTAAAARIVEIIHDVLTERAA